MEAKDKPVATTDVCNDEAKDSLATKKGGKNEEITMIAYFILRDTGQSIISLLPIKSSNSL